MSEGRRDDYEYDDGWDDSEPEPDSPMLDTSVHQAAIRGESIPEDLHDEVIVRCLIRGIRCCDGFAHELRAIPDYPAITRALNARAIMSNRVPVMDAQHVPYCFWYPDLPSEDTLRRLLDQCFGLSMRYQVGRACAAGGYTALYKELDLLPDIAIAEEARDNTTGGREIYQHVMEQPVRYAVMDDYSLSVRSEPPSGAFLNGDTCVKSTLATRQPLDKFSAQPYFDICEDWNLDILGIRFEERPIDEGTMKLSYSALPLDLPAVEKDFLILMAAWSGNIDRYARLRRPYMISGERQCVIRGIYFNTLFAKWCYSQPDLSSLRKFVHARFIMDNDLLWATDDVPEIELPTLIWYPQKASFQTYVELLGRIPAMKQQVTRAYVAINAQGPFESVDIVPDNRLVWEAGRCENDFFAQRIEQKMVSMNITDKDLYPDGLDPWEDDLRLVVDGWEEESGRQAVLYRHITPGQIGITYPARPYGTSRDMGNVLLHVAAHPPNQVPEGYEALSVLEMYQDAAYISDEEERGLVGLYPPGPDRPEYGYRLSRDPYRQRTERLDGKGSRGS
ncbi:hypothetical protein G7046_g3876 [Stylonectria norvegica]|nr:hypothetical protein G7046_g3876 [Stylonectria norvegica]